jgi:hypothetical protein
MTKTSDGELSQAAGHGERRFFVGFASPVISMEGNAV